ncbi:MAG: hypothetical protein AAFR45_11615 [Pseudomonadota bacterium]
MAFLTPISWFGWALPVLSWLSFGSFQCCHGKYRRGGRFLRLAMIVRTQNQYRYCATIRAIRDATVQHDGHANAS